MFDIHTHILPEVDDGARSWAVTLEMCRIAAADGIRHMVATPHANDKFAYDRAWLEDLLNELRWRVGGQMDFSLGCDFNLSSANLSRFDENPDQFTISGTNYLLVEFDDECVPPSLDDRLEEMLNLGYVPIITHPERNPIFQKQPLRVLHMASVGCPVQVTASALSGFWGEKAHSTALWLLARGAVHILATDCHGTTARPPVLSAARGVVEKMYGTALAQALSEENPRAVVEGKRRLPYFPKLSRD